MEMGETAKKEGETVELAGEDFFFIVVQTPIIRTLFLMN